MGPRLSLVLVLALGIALATTGYVLMGLIPAAIFTVFLVGGLVAWLLTTYGRPADPERIVVPYLLAVIFFIVHVFEEYLTEFWVAMSELTGHEIPEFNFLVIAAFIGPVLWLTGLALFCLRTEIGNYLVWAFIVAMTISELAHVVFPFVAYGHFTYFSGLYTAILPLVPALVCAVRLVQDSRKPAD